MVPLIETLTPFLAQRYAYLQARIAQLSPYPHRVTCLAVTKYLPASLIPQVWESGILHLGENRVQDACSKWEILAQKGHTPPAQSSWELIGTLQKNKLNKLLQSPWQVRRIQSLDSLELAQVLHQKVCVSGFTMPLPVLCQVNITQEPSKHGFTPETLYAQWEALQACRMLRIEGLMTILPLGCSPERQAAWFHAMNMLRTRLIPLSDTPLETLSMGMSQDWEEALKHGASCIRLGRWLYEPEAPPVLV
ncbi:MAG: YggS family pyridoxal phosphate-dependent enzyme [Vampirovibrionales bacterium]